MVMTFSGKDQRKQNPELAGKRKPTRNMPISVGKPREDSGVVATS